jgi:hypothetical protein
VRPIGLKKAKLKGKIRYKPLKQGPGTEKTYDFRTRLGNEVFFRWYFSTLLVTMNPGATWTFTASVPISTATILTAIGHGFFGSIDVTGPSETGTVTIQTGNQTSSITLASSLNPSEADKVVTLTASVSAVPPATGTPTGAVTFKDGIATLGTGTLNVSGQASFVTSSLVTGNQTITAMYWGDANFASSTSLVLNQNIWIRGDANGDGLVNMADVTKVERVILGLDPPTAGADANRDGLINMGDVTKIERFILGLDP